MRAASFWRERLSWRALSKPQVPAVLARERDFVLAALFCLVAGWFGDWLQRADHDWFTWSALGAYATLFLLARIGGWICARVLQREALALSIASVLVAASALALPLIDLQGNPVFGDIDPDYGFGVLWLVATPLAAIVLLASFRGWAPQASMARRVLAGVALPLLALHLVERSDTWSSFYYRDDTEISDEAPSNGEAEQPRADADLDASAEDLLAVQDALVDRQLATLLPQRAGIVDLYLVALAGDGAEDVFRNEVELVDAQFAARFGTGGRSQRLVNHVADLDEVPMATLRNLRRTLDGIGRMIDPNEDIVFVYMTSHGAENHDWHVQLADFSLTPIAPEDLLDAYDNAGIRWRVSVISACFSGGFIEHLEASTSLVITASRADRTSFGCGADADLTYFGRAYFVDALATTDDFVQAFATATQHIGARERAEGFLPSEPQISAGEGIRAQLELWRQQRAATRAVALTR
jgi:hypothetical protein